MDWALLVASGEWRVASLWGIAITLPLSPSMGERSGEGVFAPLMTRWRERKSLP